MGDVSILKKGRKIVIDNQPWEVTDFDFCKPGKGQALYRCKLKNMMTGATMDRTFRSSDRIEQANMEECDCVYSYKSGDQYVFNDNDTYDEIFIKEQVLAGRHVYLNENDTCKILFFNQEPLEVTIPFFAELCVTETEPGVRGDTATNVTKAATLNNGIEVQVPLFVNQGDFIRVDTRTGQYVERSKKA